MLNKFRMPILNLHPQVSRRASITTRFHRACLSRFVMLIMLAVVLTGCGSKSAEERHSVTSLATLPSSLVIVPRETGLTAYDSSGRKAWSFELLDGEQVDAPPQPAPSSTTYVRGTNSIYAISPDGKLIWRARHRDKSGRLRGLITLVDSSVAATTIDALLINYGADGQPRWTFALPEDDEMVALPTVASSGVVVVRGHRRIYTVDQGGNLIWQLELPARD